MMEYKGYTAKIELDADAGTFHGYVLHLREVVTFEGRSVRELKKAFAASVDDYLEFCAARNEEPEKPFSGNFVLRVDPAVHRRVAIAASLAGMSLNAWAGLVLEQASAEAPAPGTAGT
jgi:predicted HicB family RNase H-like nuclease